MIAGAAKIDITPQGSVWMDGMIRDHKSEGVHDPLLARALIMAQNERMEHSCVIVSVEVCGLRSDDTRSMRESISSYTGVPSEHIIIAATHTHSGPAAIGFFNQAEHDYVRELQEKITAAAQEAVRAVKPVRAGYASGIEDTISHYRRLLADDGHVVMNWEPYPPQKIVGPLGTIDPEVGVLVLAHDEHPDDIICILFNHAGHPNVLSGDNYFLSGDYPGLTARLLEQEFGCPALFVNGAEGTMDIDGLRDRDREGVERTGRALASAVSQTAGRIELSPELLIRTGSVTYTLPARTITDHEITWAEQVLKNTGGKVRSMANGVGDDYKALLFKRLHGSENRVIPVEQTCIAIGDCAFISFPGELFTEIGMHIKEESPFSHTYIIGLANGEIGYIPTNKALGEGGYAVETREAGNEAEEIVAARSLLLLEQVYRE